MSLRLLVLLLTVSLPGKAAIISGTVTASCQAFSLMPITNSAPFGQSVGCLDSPARVQISSNFDDFHGFYIWLADPNLPYGQGRVTTEFILARLPADTYLLAVAGQ